MRILIPSQSINPRRAHLLALEHDVDLLRVEPGLGVLVPVALDADLLVHDHDFDVAVAFLELGDQRRCLVLADVEEVVEVLLGGLGEGGVPE